MLRGQFLWIVVVWIGVVLNARSLAQTEATPSGAALLDAVDKKCGGPAGLAKITSVRLAGKLVVKGMAMSATIEEKYVGAEHALIAINMKGFGTSTMGSTPTFAWSTDPGVGITIREGDESQSFRRVLGLGRRAPWRSHYERAEFVEQQELGGKKVAVLKMIPKTGDPDTWYVDPQALVLCRVDTTLPDPSGGTLKSSYEFADWKEVATVLLPMKKTQIVGMMRIEHLYDTAEVNSNLRIEDISPPPEVMSAAKDPKKRSAAPSANPEACEVTDVAEQKVMSIRLMVKPAEISKILAEVLPEVMSTMNKLGVVPAGPPFSRYHKMSDTEIDFEAGIPVREANEGSGRVKVSTLPSGKAAQTWHIGAYHGLQKTYARLDEWITKMRLKKRSGPWEQYWTDPGLEPDEKKWKTQIFYPVE